MNEKRKSRTRKKKKTSHKAKLYEIYSLRSCVFFVFQLYFPLGFSGNNE